MEVTELIVKSEIIQPLELNYNKEEIERFIVAVEENYKRCYSIEKARYFKLKKQYQKLIKLYQL